jgi:hypothetical protein
MRVDRALWSGLSGAPRSALRAGPRVAPADAGAGAASQSPSRWGWRVLSVASGVGYALALAALVVLVQHDGGLAFDGHAYWLAGRAVLDGRPLYAPAEIDTLGAYLYPPIFAQLWAPFTLLPELAFDWLWRLVCVGCLRYLAGSWRNVGLWCLLPLTWRELSIANVTFPVAAAVLLAFRGRGQGLVLAGILKFGALLAVPYLWFARPAMRRTLVVGLAAAVGACAISFVLGPAAWFDYAQSLGWRASSATSADLLIAILPTTSADFLLRFALGAALVTVALAARSTRWSDRAAYAATVLASPTMFVSRLATLLLLPRLGGVPVGRPTTEAVPGEGVALPRPVTSAREGVSS